MKSVAVVGLGTMGLPIAKNLLKKSGYRVYGLDLVSERKRLFLEAGGDVLNFIEDAAAVCDVILLSLNSNDAVRDTVNRLIKVGKPGAIIVDMGSTAVELIKSLGKQAKEAGLYFVDAPVSGGESGAVSGTLSVMCSGEKEIIDALTVIFNCVGSSIVYLGELGNGNIAKLANNMIVAGSLVALGEAFAFAKKAGLDPELLYRAIRGGYADSRVLDEKAPKLISGDYSATAKASIHYKDLMNAKDLADELGVEIPAAELALAYMKSLCGQGLGDLDHCACAKISEQRMGVRISEKKRQQKKN